MSTLSYNIRVATLERSLVDVRDFQIPENHITFLFGESGIGKSLIAKAIYGLLDQEDLYVTVNGESYKNYVKKERTRQIREHSFFVFQEPSSHLNPLLTLENQLREGSLSSAPGESDILQKLWADSPRNEIRSLISVYPKPYRPSGGEKQRMLLAMAFKKIELFLTRHALSEHTMFVFDEPTGSLDNYFRDIFLSLLFEKFQQSNFTTLLITHDYSMISKVNETPQALREKIVLRELTLRQGELTVREFFPGRYTRWLERHRAGIPEARVRAKEPLLVAESGMEIFGRSHVISADRTGEEIRPLILYPGTITYVKAPSGTGKTTVVKMIMGLLRGTRMKVAIGGLTLTERTSRRFWQRHIWGRQITMVFQHADEALNPHATVRETFHGLPSKRPITVGRISQELSEFFDSAEDNVFLNKQVSTLSGGQKQKLNLLRGLFLDTNILIVDEPLNGLDFLNTGKVIEMLRKKQSAGKAILLISHNEEIFDAIVPKEDIFYLHAR
jgi:ABC-type glutathione transport system ATPase component